MQVISAARQDWILPFTGLTPAQFRKLVRLVAERMSGPSRAGLRGSWLPR